MNSCKKKLPKHGFTLIELLVVVAIISLLVSLLLPSLSTAKQLAKNAVCLGNLHNVYTGVNLYTNEFNGQLPCGDPATPYYWWWQQLASFVGIDTISLNAAAIYRSSILHCPANTSESPQSYSQVSYCPSVYVVGSNGSSKNFNYWNRPSEKALYVDSFCGAYFWDVASFVKYLADQRHLGKVNILYLDGSTGDDANPAFDSRFNKSN